MRKVPGDIASIEDLRKRAHARVPKPFMDYMEAGSFAQLTLRDNRRDLVEVLLVIQVACDQGFLGPFDHVGHGVGIDRIGILECQDLLRRRDRCRRRCRLAGGLLGTGDSTASRQRQHQGRGDRKSVV